MPYHVCIGGRGPPGSRRFPTMATAAKTMNLRLDLYEVDCHAQTYMKGLGIVYDHATPQSIGDCWWFWNCRNVPDPMPRALSILKCTPHEAIGRGLSKEDADRIDQEAAARQPIPRRNQSMLHIETGHPIRKALAMFVQSCKDDGSWNVTREIMLPGPDGPLNKADLEQIWREETGQS